MTYSKFFVKMYLQFIIMDILTIINPKSCIFASIRHSFINCCLSVFRGMRPGKFKD